MIKKIVVSTLLVGLIGGMTVGTDLFSYLSTACNRASASVERAVPIEFQIDRARQMVADLAPEVRRSMEVIAREELELDRLDNKIEAESSKAQKSKQDILRLQADLSDDREVFHYAGHTYERSQVVEDLSRRFTRHKVADETLEHLRRMRDARFTNLDAARQNLTAMVAAQKQLETDIVNLEAQRQLVEVAQASSHVVALDESRLARAKDLVNDIRSRLDVAAKLASADTSYPGEIQLDPAASNDVRQQVAAYFSVDQEEIVAEVQAGGKFAAVEASITID